jgi:hypothetical protein
VACQPYQEPYTRHDLGRMTVECRSCGALHWIHEKLSHSSINNPIFGLGCDRGQVDLPVLQAPPHVLKVLLEEDDHVGREFRENIWRYNRALAFTSLRVNEDHSVNDHHRGPPIFRIQGELYHRLGPLTPAADHQPS